MYKKKKFTAIIPARAGSKGIINKNILNINKYPLISYSIAAAKQSKYIDEIYVSTDGDKIAKISRDFGAKIIKRPKKISDDKTHADSAVTHSIKYIENILNQKLENIVFLQPTSPIRCAGDLDKAIEKFTKYNAQSLFSGIDFHSFIWSYKKSKLEPLNYNPFKRKRRQTHFNIVESGSFYISNKITYLKNNNRFSKNPTYFLTNMISLFQIDNKEDINIIKTILNSNYFKNLKFITPKK